MAPPPRGPPVRGPPRGPVRGPPGRGPPRGPPVRAGSPVGAPGVRGPDGKVRSAPPRYPPRTAPARRTGGVVGGRPYVVYTVDWEPTRRTLRLHLKDGVIPNPIDARLPDPYVVMKLSNQRPQRSRTARNTVNPKWNQDFTFQNVLPTDIMQIDVYDTEDVAADDYIATGVIKVPDLPPGRSGHQVQLSRPQVKRKPIHTPPPYQPMPTRVIEIDHWPVPPPPPPPPFAPPAASPDVDLPTCQPVCSPACSPCASPMRSCSPPPMAMGYSHGGVGMGGFSPTCSPLRSSSPLPFQQSSAVNVANYHYPPGGELPATPFGFTTMGSGGYW